MRILGISHDVLICSAALIEDGKVVAAIPEERLDRVKRSSVFPVRAIQKCLDMGGVSLSEIDEIAVGWNPGIDLETIPAGYLQARRWRTEHLSQVPARFMQLLGSSATHEMTISGAAQGCPPITFVNHYDAHIGNAFYTSPFDEAAVLVLDGRGEKQTSLLARASGVEIENLAEVRFPHSLGLFYGTITQHLGFQPDGDEWKVMALASYASADNEYYPILRDLIAVHEDGSFEMALDHFEFHNFFDRRMYSDKLVRKLGPARKQSEPLTRKHEELAAAMQRVFEETVTEILHRLHERTGLDRLVVGGGCFMNSVYNGMIERQTPFQHVFIGSSPDDSGTAVGAALWLEAQRAGKRTGEETRHNYWGPEYSDAECLELVRRFRIEAEVVEDPGARAAQDLVDGKIIGWFQGRMEFGQRALGNRSILVDPRREDGKDVVNAAIKFRESFRPFAPAILIEKVHEWFECEPGTKVPFMEKVLPFREEKKAAVPAVVHVDGSGRLQTVDRDSSPRYHALISAFEELTGVPIVLNTSYNLNGEPVVCSPEDALRTFYTCALQVLYLGNVRIAK
jgi:carbamoyltransferase